MQEINRRNVKVCTQNVVIHRNIETKQIATQQQIVVHKKAPAINRPIHESVNVPPQSSIIASRSNRNNNHKNVRQIINREPPKITYTSRDIDDASRRFISKIRGIGRGRTLVIIGNGPSIIEAPLDKLKNVDGVDTLTINKPDMRLWPTTYWAFCDMSQYRRNISEWESYQGIIINSTAVHKKKPNSFQIKNLGGYGFSLDLLRGYHIGRSTVYASMQAAVWMDYEAIYIFGCDMNPDGINGMLHFYGTNPDVEPDVRASRFEAEAEFYFKAAEILPEEVRSKIHFCSTYNQWPFVDLFVREDHKTIVDSIIQSASGSR